LGVVAKAIYLFNFHSSSSICPAAVWIISGLRSRQKMTQLWLRSSSIHEHGSSSGAVGFHECGYDSAALFFHGSSSGSGFCSFSHINISIDLVCLKL